TDSSDSSRDAAADPPLAASGAVCSPAHAAEQGLVAHLRAGDEAAFTELVDRLHRPLLRLAEAFVGRGGAAEEIVQEAWLAEIEKLPAAQRAVVTLRDVEDWTAEETCNVLGLQETNQRVILHRGRSKLRAGLELRFGKGPAR